MTLSAQVTSGGEGPFTLPVSHVVIIWPLPTFLFPPLATASNYHLYKPLGLGTPALHSHPSTSPFRTRVARLVQLFFLCPGHNWPYQCSTTSISLASLPTTPTLPGRPDIGASPSVHHPSGRATILLLRYCRQRNNYLYLTESSPRTEDRQSDKNRTHPLRRPVNAPDECPGVFPCPFGS
ncbi:hypothetical protein EDB83DRAFT_1625798 [Lactarius deliciosus]|nr:hypothetical protein EDB83DRAFT_1625798 [Lactarius deliciosus]